MKAKLSPRFWLALTLFSLIGQIAWVVENMYLNVFIYKMFHASAANISASEQAVAYYHDVVVTAMNNIRKDADILEQHTAKSYWPYPTYSDLLYY